MPRPTSPPFEGFFTGWTYGSPRALGMIHGPTRTGPIGADPLSKAVLRAYAAAAAAGTLPVGPRGIGYILLGTTVGGRRVVKDKQKVETPGMTTAARRKHLAGFYDFADIGDTIVALRRAGLLNWDWVADGRTDSHVPVVAASAAEAVEMLRRWADDIGADILADQHVYIEVWCEAADLAQAVANMMIDYGISVYSGSGDIPVGAVRDAALRYLGEMKDGKHVHVLIVGDFDIDGLGNADRFWEDVCTHLTQRGSDLADITLEWVAPLPAHLTEFAADLAAAAGGPVAKADGRALGFTLQAEALVRGGVLRTVLTRRVEALLDMEGVEGTRLRWSDLHAPALLDGLDDLASDLA